VRGLAQGHTAWWAELSLLGGANLQSQHLQEDWEFQASQPELYVFFSKKQGLGM
jgi:hypothetical protein